MHSVVGRFHSGCFSSVVNASLRASIRFTSYPRSSFGV